MIRLTAVAINQRFDLTALKTRNFAVLQLENGTEIEAEISEDACRALLAVAHDAPPSPQSMSMAEFAAVLTLQRPPSPPPTADAMPFNEEGDMVFGAPEPEPEAQSAGVQLIEWSRLPDELLPSSMKAALRFVSADPVMSGDALRELVNQISSTFDDKAWGQVLAQAQAEDFVQVSVETAQPLLTQQEPEPPSPPKLGQVTFGNGRPRLRPQPQVRAHVEKDDFGQPVVSGVSARSIIGDGTDADEFGVSQA